MEVKVLLISQQTKTAIYILGLILLITAEVPCTDRQYDGSMAARLVQGGWLHVRS